MKLDELGVMDDVQTVQSSGGKVQVTLNIRYLLDNHVTIELKLPSVGANGEIVMSRFRIYRKLVPLRRPAGVGFWVAHPKI